MAPQDDKARRHSSSSLLLACCVLCLAWALGMTALYGLAVRDGGGGGARAALDYCAGAADAQAGVGVFVNLR